MVFKLWASEQHYLIHCNVLLFNDKMINILIFWLKKYSIPAYLNHCYYLKFRTGILFCVFFLPKNWNQGNGLVVDFCCYGTIHYLMIWDAQSRDKKIGFHKHNMKLLILSLLLNISCDTLVFYTFFLFSKCMQWMYLKCFHEDEDIEHENACVCTCVCTYKMCSHTLIWWVYNFSYHAFWQTRF